MIYAAYNFPVSVKHSVLTGFEIKKNVLFLELKSLLTFIDAQNEPRTSPKVTFSIIESILL